MTVTFTRRSLLAVSTTYTVNVSGITDQAGNIVVRFTSSFTTGASGVADTTRPSVSSVSPANGASGVAVTSSIVLTVNEAGDPTTGDNGAISIFVSGYGGGLGGGYTRDGEGVRFTPPSPL